MADQVRPYAWGCAPFVPGREPPVAATWAGARRLAAIRARYVSASHPGQRASAGTVQGGGRPLHGMEGPPWRVSLPRPPLAGQGEAGDASRTRISSVTWPKSPYVPTYGMSGLSGRPLCTLPYPQETRSPSASPTLGAVNYNFPGPQSHPRAPAAPAPSAPPQGGLSSYWRRSSPRSFG